MNTYKFLKGLNQKVPQKVLEAEYKRVRSNLLRSIRGYEKRGFDVSFFDIPEKPKRITEGSLRRLQNSVNEWKYYTGRPGVDSSKLGSNVQKTGKFAYRNIGARSGRDIAIKRQQAKALESLIDEDFKLANKDNPYYQKAIDEGIDITKLPRDTDNLAIKIYEIAEEALDTGDGKTGRQQALFSVVGLKATLSIQKFNDIGVLDPKYSAEYSFNLSQQDFVAIANEFEAWLWASSQYGQPDMSGLKKVVDCMVTPQKNLSFFQKQQFAEAAAEADEAYEDY